MAKEEVKKQAAKWNNYQNIPEKLRKEVGRYALVDGTKADIDRYSKRYTEIRLKAYICKYMEFKI